MNTLQGVSATSLLTLYVRAIDASTAQPVLGDKKAGAIWRQVKESIDYTSWKTAKKSYYGILARAFIIDREVKKFLSLHPDSIVISLGCGLDTRFYRIDNGFIDWYNVDFPEIIHLREQFLTPHKRIHNIGASLLDAAWAKQVDTIGRPVLFVSEGVFMYFTTSDIQKILQILQTNFSCFTMYIDLLSKYLVHHSKQHDMCRYMEAEFTWGSQHGKEIAMWAPRIKQTDLLSFTPKLLQIGPWYWRFMAPIMYILNNRLGIYEYKR